MTRKLTFLRLTALLMIMATLISLCPVMASASSLASSPLVSGATQNGMVRVYLSSLGNPTTLNITVSGSYTVNGSSTRTLASGSSVTVRFSAATGALTLTAGGSTTDMGSAFKLRRHATDGANGLKIAQSASPNNLYPGDLSFIVRQDGASYKLYTIAYIYIEDYLYGVLPYEMNNSCPLESLKAQAVSSRTYTLRAMTAAATRNIYDVVDTTSDQVYRGTPSGNANCVAAVNATKGIVTMNGSDFTATYYTASNGGQTESVKNAWNTSANAYLSVKDDPYDLAAAGSRVRSFTVNASGAQGNSTFQSILSSKASAVFGFGSSVTQVYSIVPHTPKYLSPSRLYTKLDFSVAYTRGGGSYSGTLTFDIFSELEEQLNMSINSGDNELWTVDAASGGFVVRARRYGHGIGMSQNGAMEMARQGYTYDQILAFYFTGCRRVQYTLTRSILSAVVDGSDSTEQIIPESPAEIIGGTGCTGVVNLISSAYTLPLRQNASTVGDVLCSLPNNATVNIHGQAGDYCLVSYGKLVGYALKNSLIISGSIPGASSVSPTIPYGFATVKSALNFRESADQNSRVLATLNIGTVLPVFSVSGTWAYAQYGMIAGYVHTDYITLSSVGGGSGGLTPDAVGATVNRSTEMRMTASTNGYTVCTLTPGVEVAMLSQSGSWTMIRYNKMTGYVLSGTLTPTGRATSQTQEDTPGVGEVYATVTSGTALNLRSSPSLSGTLMTEMPGRSRMIVESRGAEWSTVRYLGVRGYAMSKYLTFSAALPVVPSIPTDTPTSGGLYARVTTNSGSLNLREDDSSTARVLFEIPKGATILLSSYGSQWCATSYGGYTGYVMTKFLTLLSTGVTVAPVVSPTPTPPSSTVGTTYARVTTRSGSLNLRQYGNGDATVLTTIPQNSYITIQQYGASWCKTSYAGLTGYVMTSFLTFVSSPGTQPVVTPTPAPVQTPPPATGVRYARVTTRSGSLNLRETASGDARVLTTIPQNAYITLTSYGASWCGTTYNGQSGYVMTSFLTLVSSAATPTPAPVPTQIPVTGAQYARVTTKNGSLNLRETASADARVLTVIPQYAYIPVSAYGADWTRTNYNGHTGYVMTKFITLVAGAPAITPTPAPVLTAPPVSGTQYARVTTQKGSLNLRENANDGARVLTTIPQYATIPINVYGATWCRTSYNGYTGYVMTRYLTLTAQTQTTTPSQGDDAARDGTLAALPIPVTARITPLGAGTYLNLRIGCSVNSTVIAQMPANDYLVILELGESWCLVEHEGKRGYCLRGYLSINE